MNPRYAEPPTAVRRWWVAALVVAVGYGLFLAVTALSVPTGADLTGRFPGQPVVKAAMCVLLALAAWHHRILRERRWLVPALLLSALGDYFLAIPWWPPAFVAGLASFLLAHLCYLAALLPLRGAPGRVRRLLVGVLLLCCLAMVGVFWPTLRADGVVVPVIVYISVLAAMVSMALLAKLPTMWTALGALLFAVSDGMIGVGRFVLGSQALELPIWWIYAAAQMLITAGFFVGRSDEGGKSVIPRG